MVRNIAKKILLYLLKHVSMNYYDEDEPARYTYSFSHFFLPSAEAPEYVEETIVRNSLEQAKILALQHLENFTIEFGDAKVNKFY